MSRRDSQFPLTTVDLNHARAAAAIVHHPPLSNAVRKELKEKRIQLGKPGYWSKFNLRSASAGKRYRPRGRKSHRRKSHRRKSRGRKSRGRKSHRRKSHRRKSHKHK